jgi:hypothetical protein
MPPQISPPLACGSEASFHPEDPEAQGVLETHSKQCGALKVLSLLLFIYLI